ncbi:MAG: hypothetical protein RR513_05770 [Muribaculaceae bacterium]
MELTIDVVRDGLRAFNAQPKQSILGIVADVDIQNRTCTVEDDGVLYYDVALQACPECMSGVVLIPQIASAVVMAKIEDSDALWTVIATTKIDKIDIAIDKIEIEVSASGVVVNSGINGGLVNVAILKQWMTTVRADLLAVQAALNSLQVPVVITSSAPNDALEDKLIKH